MRFVVAQAAFDDLAGLHAFPADENITAANRATAALIAAVQSLHAFPERGRPSGTPNIRELIVPFGQSNYALRYAYREQADEVVVLPIWHGRGLRE
jgi:plasmid stabilization system protein ParE